MFDINGLKEVNDTKGHESGDVLIRSAADILAKSFEDARIFRIGGDEFVVIINTREENISNLLDKYERNVAGYRSGDSSYIIMSRGCTRFDASTDKSFEDTFKRADRLMYENKKAYYQNCGNRRR